MSNFIKRYRWLQRERERAATQPGTTVPGTGSFKRRRKHLKMRPYERPRKGGGKRGQDND